MKKILALLMFIYVNYMGVYVVQAQTQNVSFSDTNGISGTISLDISLGYNFEPYFVAKQNKVVIKSYQNGKYDAVLRKNGISFPYTLDESNRFDFTADIIIQKGSAVIERVSSDFNTTRGLGSGHVFPPFSEKAKEWLKNEGTDKSIVGREMSGGEASWSKYAKIQNIKVVKVYVTDFKNNIDKIIRDEERQQKEQERKLAEEKKQKEEQAKKEQLAKEEADKKVTAQTNEERKTTQDSQNIQSTEGEKTVTGNSENELKQTADTGRSTQTTTSQNNTRDYQREWQETQERARRENERRRLQEERNKELGNELGKTIYDVTKDIEIKDGGNTTFLTYSIYTNQTFLGQLSFGTRGYAGEVFYLGIGVNLTHGSLEYWTSGNASQYSLSPVVGPGFQIGIGFGFREDLLSVREKHGDYEVFTFGITGAFDYLFDTGTETTTSTKSHHPLLSLRPNVSYNISKHFAVTLGYNIGINGNELFDEEALVFYTSPDKWEGEPIKGLKSIVVGLGFTW